MELNENEKPNRRKLGNGSSRPTPECGAPILPVYARPPETPTDPEHTAPDPADLCDNCGEACGDPHCGKCSECGGEVDDEVCWPETRCYLCQHKAMRRAYDNEPCPFDI